MNEFKSAGFDKIHQKMLKESAEDISVSLPIMIIFPNLDDRRVPEEKPDAVPLKRKKKSYQIVD